MAPTLTAVFPEAETYYADVRTFGARVVLAEKAYVNLVLSPLCSIPFCSCPRLLFYN